MVGVATGLITGATGVFVFPAVPSLALGLERDELVQALGLSFTVSTLALAAGLAWHAALRAQSLATSLLALVPALLGMALEACSGGAQHPTRSAAASSWACWHSAPRSCGARWRDRADRARGLAEALPDHYRRPPVGV